MLKPLVSVITPVYNEERFICACIESVLEQTYPNWEMIIADDGSTDKTLEIISQYKDDRIKIFPQPHRGIMRLHETYHAALSESNGDLIGLLDDDDMWPSQRLEKQVPFFNDERVVLVFGRVNIVNENGWFRDPFGERSKRASKMINRPVGAALKDLLSNNYIPASTVLLKKTALEKIGGFQQPHNFPSVDYPTWLNLALTGEFRFINEPMGYRRIHLDATSAKSRVEQEQASGKYATDFFQQLDPEIKSRIKISQTQLKEFSKRKLARGHMEAGRYCLARNERAQARNHFFSAIMDGNTTVKLISLIGLISACTPLDLEKLAQMMGRFKYQ